MPDKQPKHTPPILPVDINTPQAEHFERNPKLIVLVKRHRVIAILLTIVLIMAVSIAAAFIWFTLQLQPRDASAEQRRVTIENGIALADMSRHLHEEGIIKSQLAFQLYVRLQGVQGDLQAGTYILSPAQSVEDVVTHLVEGKVDAFTIRIPAGKTLKELQAIFKTYGFSDGAITTAFTAQYEHPLLATKPAGASLEGYIFPDTYEINGNGEVSDLLTRSFDRFNTLIIENNVISKLAAQNMNVHQGITLASIVQKEVSDVTDQDIQDQKQVAQVFLKRLREDMPLGSDVTFMYAAQQLGVEPRVNLESPYNTRINKGLPPGPIANFNVAALKAIADPAPGDYLYFVAGDDKKTYFSHTNEEHEENVRLHCTKLCQ